MSGLLSTMGENADQKHNVGMFRPVFFYNSVILTIRIFTLVLSGFILISIPAASGNPAASRPRFETDIGYGYPESLCLKVRYGDKVQAGLSQAFDTHGFGPSGLEVYYRIGKKPRLLDQPPWYVLGGLAGYIFTVPYKKEYKLLFYPRTGRSFYFTKKIGINLDIGLGFPFGRDSEGGNPVSPILLTGSMNIFIRI